MDYEKFKIKEFNHWIVYLHGEFYCQYLGSVYIWAKRDEDVDIMEMSAEEREELFEIGKKVKKALTELFSHRPGQLVQAFDAADPPIYESQGRYLWDRGLLGSDERRVVEKRGLLDHVEAVVGPPDEE